MKQKILITGIAGSGKSSICRELSSMGHETYGIEDIDDMFAMFRKDTGELYEGYTNTDPEMIKNAEWRCNVNKLKELIEQQNNDIAFYCGIASNMDDILPFFDRVFVLKASPAELHRRLSTREGTEDMGNTEEGRQAVLGWKDWWEDQMVEKGATTISADTSLQEVARAILEKMK